MKDYYYQENPKIANLDAYWIIVDCFEDIEIKILFYVSRQSYFFKKQMFITFPTD